MKKLASVFLAAILVLSVLGITAAAEGEPAPIAVYNFEDASNLGKDVSGNKNNLAKKGEVDSAATGKYGKGVTFNYAGALVASADKDGKDFVDKIELSGSKKFTIMYWIKYSDNDFDSWDPAIGWRRAVSNGNDGGAGYGGFSMLSLADNYVVPTTINPAIVFYTEAVGSQSVGNWSTYAWTTEWTNIAWTCDATTGRCMFYVNGTAIFDLTTEGLKNGGALSNLLRNFAVGANYLINEEGQDVFNHPYAGSIDDMYIFDEILDESQIAYYMNNNYVVPKEKSPDTADFTAVMATLAITCGAVLCFNKKKH